MQRHHSRFETIRPATTLLLGLTASLILASCGSDAPSESRPITASIDTNKARAPIGSPIAINYRFDVGADSAPIEKDYRVFVHFLDSHNALLFNDDHDPPEPTSEWSAGDTLEYERTLFIPLYPYLGTATVQVGLYIPETGERLGLSGTETGNLAYQVGQIELLDQKENIFLVYKEGWHQLENDPDNHSMEWQWTKREAVCSFRNPKKESVLYLEADTNVNAFEEPLEVAVMVGDTEITRFKVEDRDPFLKKITIPASALGDEDWVDLRLVNSESFVPADKNIGDDTRELGLRVHHLYVDTYTGT
jgi:hypothetical protein